MSNVKAAITLGNLKHALKMVADVVPAKITIPIIGGVRMQQVEKGLAIEATDMDTYLRVYLKEMGGPAEPIVTPARKFIDWAKLLTGEDVKISTTGTRATLQCGRSKVVFPLMAANAWPMAQFVDLESSDAVTLTQGALARALRFAAVSMSEEEARHTFNAIVLDADGTTLRAASTDGYRLTIYSIPCDDKFRVMLPARYIKVIRPLLTDEAGGVDLCQSDNAIRATFDAENVIQIGSRKMEGQFPNYQGALPKLGDRRAITVDAAAFTKAAERVRLLADEDAMRMTLEFSATEQIITMAAASSQNGEGTEVIDCKGLAPSGFKMALNPKYLLDMIRCLDGDITLMLGKNGNEPFMLQAEPHKDEHLTYVVMPMRQ